jgi:hypothetical protein
LTSEQQSGKKSWRYLVVVAEGKRTKMASRENFFYRLCALRVAKLINGRETNLGTYRNLVRQYAREFGNPALGEALDDVVFGPMFVLWEERYLELAKMNLQTLTDQDFSAFSNNWNGMWKFLNGNGFKMKLRPKGRELINEMEAAMEPTKPLEHKTIGF